MVRNIRAYPKFCALSAGKYTTNTNQYALDHAADRGTSVHKATENIDRYGSADIDDEYAGYVQAYVSFLREHDVIWSDIEKPMYHPVKHYAGTIDRFGCGGWFQYVG